MHELAVVLGYVLVVGFLFFLGLLMLLSPPRFRRFLNWFTRANLWSQAVPEDRSRGSFETRLAGLIFCSLCLYMIRPVVTRYLNFEHLRGSPGIVGTWSAAPTWHSLAAGLCLLVFGLWATLWPQYVVKRWINQISDRNVPDSTAELWIRCLRIMGVIASLIGLSIIGFDWIGR